MLTRIDHVMICVPDLPKAIDAYTRIGFGVRAGGVHPDGGTENAIAFFQDDYLELLAVRKGEERLASAALLDFLARGPGLRYVALQSDDLAADVAAMRRRGVDVGDPVDGGRRTPDGHELRWQSARLGASNPLPIFFIEHLTPLAERRRGHTGEHPNGARRTERVYIAVSDVAKAADLTSRVRATRRGAGAPFPAWCRCRAPDTPRWRPVAGQTGARSRR